MKISFSQSSRDDFPSNKGLGENSILEDIAKTRFALETAYAGFDNATDPDLIDCYIYEVNSVLKRYKYLLDQAAKMNMLPEEKSDPESPVYSLIG